VLAGLPAEDIDDILTDYTAYFEEARASRRAEEGVAAALGDPRRLARELRAETGLRRWENHHSLRNSTAALLALGGLAAVDLLLLLPLLLAVVLILLVAGLVMFVLGVIGAGLLLSLFKIAHAASIAQIVLRAFGRHRIDHRERRYRRVAVVRSECGGEKLGDYARLHYRLLKPEQPAA